MIPLPPHTTAELGLAMHEELRAAHFREAQFRMAIQSALKHLKRDEIARAEAVLRAVVSE